MPGVGTKCPPLGSTETLWIEALGSGPGLLLACPLPCPPGKEVGEGTQEAPGTQYPPGAEPARPSQDPRPPIRFRDKNAGFTGPQGTQRSSHHTRVVACIRPRQHAPGSPAFSCWAVRPLLGLQGQGGGPAPHPPGERTRKGGPWSASRGLCSGLLSARPRCLLRPALSDQSGPGAAGGERGPFRSGCSVRPRALPLGRLSVHQPGLLALGTVPGPLPGRGWRRGSCQGAENRTPAPGRGW